jgi:hypothetical protein
MTALIFLLHCLIMLHARRHYKLVVGLLTAPGNFVERDACRETWFKLLPSGVSVLHLFMLGESGNASTEAQLDGEQRKHGDLLRFDVQDGYRQLVRKTGALYDYLAARTDVTFDYLLKTDDDSFVRLDKLVQLLDSAANDVAFNNQTFVSSLTMAILC